MTKIAIYNYFGMRLYIRASELFNSDLHLGSLIQIHPVVKEILKQKGQYQG